MVTIQGLYNTAVCCASEREVDFEKLDALIRREIPYSREVRGEPHPLNAEIDLTRLRCAGQVKLDRAGRLMSRRAAFSTLSMEEFRKEMEGVYTTCVLPDTLDESPMAYKSIDEIVAQIGPTAEIAAHIRPVYNFKAAD